jgi:hypothetical protein
MPNASSTPTAVAQLTISLSDGMLDLVSMYMPAVEADARASVIWDALKG